jgi:hypothetical protein
MTIINSYVEQSVQVSDLLCCGTDSAKAIARQMLMNHIEAQIECLPEEDIQGGRIEIEGLLNTDIADSTEEYFNDLFNDVKANIRSYIQQGAKVKVRRLEYSAMGGLTDIAVDVDLPF